MEPLHPPYGVTQPRQLIRWEDVNSQNGKLQRVQNYLKIQDFTLNVDTGILYLDKVAQINFTSPHRISIDIPSLKAFVASLGSVFSVALAYIDNGKMVRYIVNPGLGELYPYTDVYVGQPMDKSFCIEIWNTLKVTPALAQINVPSINILTSLRGNSDYRYSDDVMLSDGAEFVGEDVFFCNHDNTLNIPLPLVFQVWVPNN